MDRNRNLKTIVTIERNSRGIVLKSNNGICWVVDGITPEVAIIAIVSNTLSQSLKYEDDYSDKFTIEMIIKHKHDENNI